MPGADPARTGVQPGPNLTTLPEIKQRADIVGMGMALADNVLVVVTESTVRAFDANSLTELWSNKAGLWWVLRTGDRKRCHLFRLHERY